jgi:drug/metabolite transporter (DMT)-like permease
MTRRAWLLFSALCVIWGLPYLLTRVAVRQVDPATLVLFRCAPAAVLLLPYAAWRGSLAPAWRKIGWVALYASLEFALPWLLMSRAERTISSSLTAVLVAAVPIMAVVATRFTGAHEHLSLRRGVGLVIGAAGVVVLVGIDVRGASLVAVGEMLLVCLGYAVAPFVISTRLHELAGEGVVSLGLAITALAYAPFGLSHLPESMSPSVAWSVVMLVLVPTIMGMLAFFALILEAGPARSTVVTYVNPAVAVLLGILLLHEPLTAGLVVGFPMIIAGSILGTSTERPAELDMH